ncbi:hypothetical protein NX059_006188 [Plenodomus lindquistii]|nr:hypothetical protein NX059_006188 [Plenodomus lindquistii]
MSRYHKLVPKRSDRIDRRRRAAIDWQYWPDTSNQQQYSTTTLDSEIASRPDIEDEALIAWGIIQSKESTDQNVSIDMLIGEGTNFRWQYDVSDEALERSLTSTNTTSKERTLRMCFINTLDTNASWLPGNFDIRPQTIRILRKAGLSKVLLTNIFTEQGYWAKMGNQQVLLHDADGALASFEVCYQYRCGWDTGVSFIHLVRTRNTTLYFCINFPAYAMTRLKAVVRDRPALAHRDFLPDALVADDSLKQWQHEIGHRRDMLQTYEKQYEDNGVDPDYKRATIDLHRLTRHWLTLGQDCQDFQAQLGFLEGSYQLYKKTLNEQPDAWTIDTTVDVSSSFEMLHSQCDTCIRWTSVYHDRTSLRINLLFQLTNQREARTNTQIAASSADIAREARRDSASMITMAAVTMVFLPGTFISTVLSTTFFDYGDDGLHVSSRWWVLMATTIPLTIVVFAVWLGWRQLRLRRWKEEAVVKPPE